MKVVLTVAAVVVLCGFFASAQQTPPADGVGLGNAHLSPNSSVSDVPSMSPDQNSVMADSNGWTTGDKGIPAFAGYSDADSATRMNGQGPMGASESSSATALRRTPYGEAQSTQNRAIVAQNGNQPNPNLGASAQKPGQGSGTTSNPPQ